MLSSLNWLAPDEGFEAITRLLHLETYQYSILLGLTISAGGLTESLVSTNQNISMSKNNNFVQCFWYLNAETFIDIHIKRFCEYKLFWIDAFYKSFFYYQSIELKLKLHHSSLGLSMFTLLRE